MNCSEKNARGNKIINRDGKAIDLCIYYVEEQHKQALREVDKQAATKLFSASWATNLCVVAYRDFFLLLRRKQLKKNALIMYINIK